MVVITQLPRGGVSGLRGAYIPATYSPTMVSEANIATVNRSLQTTGDWARIAAVRPGRFSGLGYMLNGTEDDKPVIPMWAWLGIGGLAAGLAGGFLLFKKGR